MNERVILVGHSNLISAAWFVASFITTSFCCLLVYSGGYSTVVPLIGESIASLRPGVLFTPVWATITYQVVRLILPKKLLGSSTATALISGCVSFLLLVVVYDRHLVPYLAKAAGRTEFEQDTWANYFFAMVACVTIGVAAECLVAQLVITGSSNTNSEAAA